MNEVYHFSVYVTCEKGADELDEVTSHALFVYYYRDVAYAATRFDKYRNRTCRSDRAMVIGGLSLYCQRGFSCFATTEASFFFLTLAIHTVDNETENNRSTLTPRRQIINCTRSELHQ